MDEEAVRKNPVEEKLPVGVVHLLLQHVHNVHLGLQRVDLCRRQQLGHIAAHMQIESKT